MGDIITNPPTTPNTVSDSWQPLVERDTMSYFGKNKITLTNWDASTTAPAIAQGSTIDIDGSIARFTADEAIGGAPADGTVYLMFVVSGAIVTAEWTAEFPTWAADKGGWYTATGNRCSGHNSVKAGTAFSSKSRFSDENQGDSFQTLAAGGGYFDGPILSDNLRLNSQQLTETQYSYNSNTDTSTLLSPGIHYIQLNSTGTSTSPGVPVVAVGSVECNVGGSWVPIQEARTSVDNASGVAQSFLSVISDGINYRVRATITETEPTSYGTVRIIVRTVL